MKCLEIYSNEEAIALKGMLILQDPKQKKEILLFGRHRKTWATYRGKVEKLKKRMCDKDKIKMLSEGNWEDYSFKGPLDSHM